MLQPWGRSHVFIPLRNIDTSAQALRLKRRRLLSDCFSEIAIKISLFTLSNHFRAGQKPVRESKKSPAGKFSWSFGASKGDTLMTISTRTIRPYYTRSPTTFFCAMRIHHGSELATPSFIGSAAVVRHAPPKCERTRPHAGSAAAETSALKHLSDESLKKAKNALAPWPVRE